MDTYSQVKHLEKDENKEDDATKQNDTPKWYISKDGEIKALENGKFQLSRVKYD